MTDQGQASASSLPTARDIVDATFPLVRDYSALASKLPTDEYEYHCAFRGFTRHVAAHEEALLTLMDACVRQVPKKRRVTFSAKGGLNAAQRHSAVMESVDSLLENVDHLLDESRGHKIHAEDQLHVAFGSSLEPQTSAAGGQFGNRFTIIRPQLSFRTPVNNSLAPFQARIHNEDGSVTVCEAGVHPYQSLIESFKVPHRHLMAHEDTPYLPLDVTPLHVVESLEQLQALIATLQTQREIAVDLEHHDFHSYQGMTCLMQISTRSEDYIVDCLKLRDEMHRLNAVFLNPEVLKVFHGAKEDVRWLQKDFDLYLANMFDTGIALQTLHMPHSLAFAVDHFCQVRLDKKYQTADWRIRPIPGDMVHYARQDTHYLLYVYDRLKSLLVHTEGRASVGNLLLHVFSDSRTLCLTRYEKPAFDPNESFKAAMGRSFGGLNPMQTEVLRLVFNWRDDAARQADESPHAIMHTAAVLQIASKLPTSAREVLKCCAPVSVVVRRDVGLLVDTITQAMASFEGSVPGVAGGVATAGGAAEGAGGSAHAIRGQTFAHVPRSGTLPSIAFDAAVDDVIESDMHDAAAKVVIRGDIFRPSAWFVALGAHAARVAQIPPLDIALPGHAVTARITLKPKSVPSTKETHADVSKAEGDVAAPSQELLGDSVSLTLTEDRLLDVEEPGQQMGSSEENAASGLSAGQEDRIAVGAQKEKKAAPTSLFEEFGSGRSNRRKAGKRDRE